MAPGKSIVEYTEDEHSCWVELYGGDCEKILKNEVAFELFYKEVSFANLRKHIVQQPFIRVAPKNASMDLKAKDLVASVKQANDALNKVPRVTNRVGIQVIVAEKNDDVVFHHACTVTFKGTTKYMPPRLVISLAKYNVPANCGVRINTGLIINTPRTYAGENGQKSIQEPFIIIPQIQLDGLDDGIIPSMYARDVDDTGLLTINFTTTKAYEKNLELKVALQAFAVAKPADPVSVSNPIAKSSVFKSKDNLAGRSTKNAKLKFLANSGLMDNKNHLQFATFDHKATPIIEHADQKLNFKNVNVVFSSRKREWYDPRLVSITGVAFNNGKKNIYAPPHVVAGSIFQHNTHCITFISSKVMVFSESVTDIPITSRLLNGAFSDIENYPTINKRLRECVNAIQGLYTGAISCTKQYETIKRDHTEPDYDDITFEALLTAYDYDRKNQILTANMVSRLGEIDEALFKTRCNETVSAFSVEIKKAMCILAYTFMRDMFTEDELNQLHFKYGGTNKYRYATVDRYDGKPDSHKKQPISTKGYVLEPIGVDKRKLSESSDIAPKKLAIDNGSGKPVSNQPKEDDPPAEKPTSDMGPPAEQPTSDD